MSNPGITSSLALSSAALADYQEWLKAIKQRIHATRMKGALAANGELISLYYEIGAQIVDRESLYPPWNIPYFVQVIVALPQVTARSIVSPSHSEVSHAGRFERFRHCFDLREISNS